MTTFTPEQTDFAASVADFCAREAGTREQRDALTAGGTELHSVELYKKMADLGWAGMDRVRALRHYRESAASGR